MRVNRPQDILRWEREFSARMKLSGGNFAGGVFYMEGIFQGGVFREGRGFFMRSESYLPVFYLKNDNKLNNKTFFF